MFTLSNTKQITINNLFNKLEAVSAVAADASMGMQICGPMPDSFYNGNVHYKMEGVLCIRYNFFFQVSADSRSNKCGLAVWSFISTKLLKILSVEDSE